MDFVDNQDGSDWRDDDEKLPGHENLTEKDIELFRQIQELALQVGALAHGTLGGTCTVAPGTLGWILLLPFYLFVILGGGGGFDCGDQAAAAILCAVGGEKLMSCEESIVLQL